jgi:hypothetical protein
MDRTTTGEQVTQHATRSTVHAVADDYFLGSAYPYSVASTKPAAITSKGNTMP